MRVYELRQPERLRLRTHPWVASESNAAHRYYDFQEHPELIRSSLEDLIPWESYASTETFYGLIEWLNRPDGLLCTNDCAFNGVSPNQGPHSDLRLEASGRLMLLFRDLSQNLSADRVAELTQRLAVSMSTMTPNIEAVAGVSVVDVRLTDLPGPPERQLGQQLMLSIWAWGNDEAETMHNFDLALRNIGNALRQASVDWLRA